MTDDELIPAPGSEEHTGLIPAATVLLVRDGTSGLEVLMLRRNSAIAFGGMWVFPGGRVDEAEVDLSDEVASARRAAVREAEEETGLRVTAHDLVPWSLWIPPLMAAMKTPGPRRRFSTWFFVAAAPDGVVMVDDGEILEHAWLAPEEALAKRDAGEIELVPPTWVTLHQLAGHRSVHDTLSAGRAGRPERFETRPLSRDPITLAWHGDAGYDSGDPDVPGERHRLIMHRHGWHYERS